MKKTQQKIGTRIGILGGGQLAQMLILQGHRLGLEMHVLCPQKDEPAAIVTQYWHKGDPHDKKDISDFCKKIDILTFESEFVHGKLLEEIAHDGKIQISPSPRAMQLLQDRLSQKQLLEDFQVPTAKFIAIHNKDDLQLAGQHFKNKFVLKKRFGGYDGNGTFIIKSTQDLKKALHNLPLVENEFIAEAFISFKRELALIFVRNPQGQIISLPLVQTKQTENRLDWLQGPIAHPRMALVIKKIYKFLAEIDYVGAIGFELFDCGTEILVNEIAPRVHNSGHYSQDALSDDQFSLHLKALLSLELTKPVCLNTVFVCTNLIGQSECEPKFPNLMTGTLHWYGKKKNRKGRKMGHVNYLGKNKTQLLKLALSERKKFQL